MELFGHRKIELGADVADVSLHTRRVTLEEHQLGLASVIFVVADPELLGQLGRQFEEPTIVLTITTSPCDARVILMSREVQSISDR